MSTYFACENVFTKQLIELLLIHSAEKPHITFCHWHLNGLMAHNFIKVSLLETLAVTNDYDIICCSEKFLDSSIKNDDDRISIPEYNLFRADHPRNIKRGDVRIITRTTFLLPRKMICVSCMNVLSLN